VPQAGEGLHPSREGERVWGSPAISGPRSPAGSRSPGAAGGFWRWKASSGGLDRRGGGAEQALPAADAGRGGEIEIRPVFEAEDVGAELTLDLRAQEARLRAAVERPAVVSRRS
jgi:hypothetical protein